MMPSDPRQMSWFKTNSSSRLHYRREYSGLTIIAAISNKGDCYARIVQGTVNSEVFIAFMLDFTNMLYVNNKNYYNEEVILYDRF